MPAITLAVANRLKLTVRTEGPHLKDIPDL